MDRSSGTKEMRSVERMVFLQLPAFMSKDGKMKLFRISAAPGEYQEFRECFKKTPTRVVVKRPASIEEAKSVNVGGKKAKVVIRHTFVNSGGNLWKKALRRSARGQQPKLSQVLQRDRRYFPLTKDSLVLFELGVAYNNKQRPDLVKTDEPLSESEKRLNNLSGPDFRFSHIAIVSESTLDTACANNSALINAQNSLAPVSRRRRSFSLPLTIIKKPNPSLDVMMYFKSSTGLEIILMVPSDSKELPKPTSKMDKH